MYTINSIGIITFKKMKEKKERKKIYSKLISHILVKKKKKKGKNKRKINGNRHFIIIFLNGFLIVQSMLNT